MMTSRLRLAALALVPMFLVTACQPSGDASSTGDAGGGSAATQVSGAGASGGKKVGRSGLWCQSLTRLMLSSLSTYFSKAILA